MKDFYFKHFREQVIHTFLTNENGSKHDLLLACNAKTRELDSEKEIGLRALEKHLKELKEKHGHPIESYRPSSEELIAKNYSGNIVEYPHKKVDVRKVKFLRYYESYNLEPFIRDDEKIKIDEAFIILKRFIGIPGWEWLDVFIEEDNYNLNLEPFINQKISFEENMSGAKRWYHKIKDCILNKYVIKVHRSVHNSTTGEHILLFHSHYLKLWKNKWYAFGYANELTQKREFSPYVLPIDENIVKIENSKVKLKTNTINYNGEPLNTYFFKDIIGVTNHKRTMVSDVVIRVHDANKFDRLKLKPPHFSWMVIDSNKKYNDVSMNVKINNELLNFLYENSSGIEVLKPNSLRMIMAKKLNLAASYY
tara:strand:- start:1395 stop:2489 length:1095 start_codon:yes stop_codon:yes gene_type:complete